MISTLRSRVDAKDRDSSLNGMNWKEVNIGSTVPTRILRRKVQLRGIELKWGESAEKSRSKQPGSNQLARDTVSSNDKVVIIYCQGNAGTPLLRIPLFRQLLKPEPQSSLQDLTVLAVAPRSFWLSTRSTPTESSVLADYRAALEYAYAQHGSDCKYVLYGHSLGGAASLLLLEQLSIPPFNPPRPQSAECSSHPSPVHGLILENPLPSIPYMVKALYPQRWLPYHYLGFAAFDRWDALGRLRNLARSSHRDSSQTTGVERRTSIPSLWIRSGRDEIVPSGQADGVREMFEDWKRASEGDRKGPGGARWVDIEGALHDTAFLERKWRLEIRKFLQEIAEKRSS
ncbi:uncharacterized protein JCM6883_002259 [Sporobolomyces salmoneus]|uniref:uncharacterized protein n=1 Tax=Sporobolomyces salmoneus TaxID=183962 RepID=UPI003182B720